MVVGDGDGGVEAGVGVEHLAVVLLDVASIVSCL